MLSSVGVATTELEFLRTEDEFNKVLNQTEEHIEKCNITSIMVPMRKSVPVRLDDGGEAFHATTISQYFELIDTILNELAERFNTENKSALRLYRTLEECLLNVNIMTFSIQ